MCVSSLMFCFLWFWAHFLIPPVVLLLLNFKNSLYVLDKSPLSDVSFKIISFQSVAYLLILLTLPFAKQKCLMLIKPSLSIILLMDYTFGVIYVISLPDIFFISYSTSSMLIYQNMIEFCILALYPENMLDSWICPSSFCTDTFGFSTKTFVSSSEKGLCLSFHVCFLLLFIALSGTFHTMLNKGNKRRCSYLDPNFRGEALSVLPLSIMLVVGFFCLFV